MDRASFSKEDNAEGEGNIAVVDERKVEILTNKNRKTMSNYNRRWAAGLTTAQRMKIIREQLKLFELAADPEKLAEKRDREFLRAFGVTDTD